MRDHRVALLRHTSFSKQSDTFEAGVSSRKRLAASAETGGHRLACYFQESRNKCHADDRQGESLLREMLGEPASLAARSGHSDRRERPSDTLELQQRSQGRS